MKITALVENTSCDPAVGAVHGLSLAIEGCKRNILFDMGPSDLLARNAAALHTDLGAFDLAVVSHGHNDHGGGLPTFLQANRTAPVYVREDAFGPFFSRKQDGSLAYIGLDPALAGHPQLVRTGNRTAISDRILLFSGVPGTRFLPTGNRHLRKKEGDLYPPDDFAHEQNLLLTEGESLVLVAGCAHRGIANIMEACKSLTGRYPTHVIGGFHLSGREGPTETEQTLAELAAYLTGTGARFYTCHCTGRESFDFLRRQMGDRIEYLPAGRCITIETREHRR